MPIVWLRGRIAAGLAIHAAPVSNCSYGLGEVLSGETADPVEERGVADASEGHEAVSATEEVDGISEVRMVCLLRAKDLPAKRFRGLANDVMELNRRTLGASESPLCSCD